jgi:hypothetical protein
MKNNIDREWVDSHKFRWFKESRKWNIGSKITARYSQFSDFSIPDIQSKFSWKIEWILLDVDDCIAPAYSDILEENIEKINEILNSGIKIWILSNWQKIEERINKIQEKVWNRLQICNTWTKPDPQSFLKACEQLQITPENTLMVWDDIWIDGWALQLDEDWKQLLWGFVHIEPIWNSYFKIPIWKIPNYIWKNICRWYINNKNK